MTKTITFLALCAFSAVSFAAAPAACIDRTGKKLPVEKCQEASQSTGKELNDIPGFNKRKARVLTDMRHAETVLKKTIACAEKSRNEVALRACASKEPRRR